MTLNSFVNFIVHFCKANGEMSSADVMASKELERKAFNEHGQKGWSLLAWFTPTKWAEGDCNDCASVVSG